MNTNHFYKNLKLLIFILLAFLLFSRSVFASSGMLKGDSIITCNGITYGYHSDHWHKASQKNNHWYPDGDPIYTNPCGNTNNNSDNTTSTENNNTSQNTTSTESQNNSVNNTVISNDTSLKSVTINDDSIDVSDNMNYTTNISDIKIYAIANDSNAKVTISDYSTIEIGNNDISINVIAEDGTQKTYSLVIYKTSNNTDISIFYNNEEIDFNSLNTAELSTIEETIKFTIKSNDNTITTDIKESYKLESGENQIIITATAEDGTTKEYTINVTKANARDLFLGFIVLIIIGIIIYKVIKKKKKEIKKTSC